MVGGSALTCKHLLALALAEACDIVVDHKLQHREVRNIQEISSFKNLKQQRINILLLWIKIMDGDPDPVGSFDFWPSGSVTFFIGSYL